MRIALPICHIFMTAVVLASVAADTPPTSDDPQLSLVPFSLWSGQENEYLTTADTSSSRQGLGLSSISPIPVGDYRNKKQDNELSQFNPNQDCEEKHYDFSDPKDLDAFRIESCAQNVRVEDGSLAMDITPECKAATIGYRVLMSEGRVTARMRAPNMNGTVTCMIMMGTHIQDEIDIEIVGSSLGVVQTMLWSNGERIPGYERSQNDQVPHSDASRGFIEFAIEFTHEYIAWFMNGELIRVIRKDQILVLPTFANELKFGLWDGSDFGFWAGTVDYSVTPKFTAYVDSMTVKPFGECGVRTDEQYISQKKNPVKYEGPLFEMKGPIPAINRNEDYHTPASSSSSSSRMTGWFLPLTLSLGLAAWLSSGRH
ncbi:concanavalin A-like lectin/glucanase domain-containing protein [Dimargaris cristalligena]|uniref:Concanavalin A-like lectin/glucanase domain-containing protein n=1 Tax=Dimargaris cristalligena TaxID=215637 RepID=A0A4P9ZNK2_9FUNG|nr:concanavalin A-like lectin/glucanase domain-containing protein [Dimargaris cristalligena]|eukprot:RKP34718.1 concanavalin A-like lectin/glucanase domain-containing protein [Dimargaris cristalligena]